MVHPHTHNTELKRSKALSKKRTRRDYRNKNMLRSDSGAKPKKKGKKKYVENLKEKFRKSQEWKDFRSHMAILFNHRDYITGRRLVKGYNVHHLKTEQEADTYCDISNEENFIPLNSYCHKLLHYLFGYYKKDPTVLDRLKEILDKMCELNKDEEIELPPEEMLDNQELEDRDFDTMETSPDSSMGSLGNETVS